MPNIELTGYSTGAEGRGCECDSGAVDGAIPNACLCVGEAGSGDYSCADEVFGGWQWWQYVPRRRTGKESRDD